jgi:hypothetical protein
VAWNSAAHWVPSKVWGAVSIAAVLAIFVWLWRAMREIKQHDREVVAMRAHLNRITNAQWN